ncbi:MAG TPA: phenylalanine--tRNA ligase subunit beta, partial [Candidatus Omnitrophica bacterium]|nr:phenylalanine--tRNA ligase subunit beta [Candidatus Omnitrophota bacterium]
VCIVDIKDGKPKQIICGAPNVRKGAKVPVALPGTVLPAGIKIERRQIRTLHSEGMICSEEELGLGGDAQGILILPDSVNVGGNLGEELGLIDTVLVISVTPNRGDCLSVVGIAREIAALSSQKLKMPDSKVEEQEEKVEDKIHIQIENPDLCKRYTSKMVTGVHIESSPLWMRRRLILSGLRPINNIVDITNYVMIEMGQPLHAFDYEKLQGKKIIVRCARKKEKILCLDGVERTLLERALVISDGSGPVAIAGVMGGEEAGVDESTEMVLLESAHFVPWCIRRTSKSLNLVSESSYRFERGVDPEGTVNVLLRACHFIQKIAKGEVLSGVVDIKEKSAKKLIRLNPGRIKRILGIPVPSHTSILRSLGFQTEKRKDYYEVEIPSWRFDVSEEIDLIEEIARIYDYDRIPSTLPKGELPSSHEEKKREVFRVCRDILTRLSLTEVMCYSFIGPTLLSKFLLNPTPNAIQLDNPVSEDFRMLRFSLIPGLLKVAEENISRGERDIKIFELHSVYHYGEDKSPREPTHLALLITGNWTESSWLYPGEKASFYRLKGIIQTLFSELGIDSLRFEESTHPSLAREYSFSIWVEDTNAGLLGEVNSLVMENFSLPEKTYISELSMEKLLPFVRLKKKVTSPPKYPPVMRDISLLVPSGVSASQIEKIILDEAKELVEKIKLFDCYEGEQIPKGYKSLSYSIYFRSEERTLTDSEMTGLQERIIRKLEKDLGLQLRS